MEDKDKNIIQPAAEAPRTQAVEGQDTGSILDDVTNSEYKYGFVTDIETDVIERGLNEDVIRHISERKGEPEWLLEFRLKAYRHWLTLSMPTWAHLDIPDIDFGVADFEYDRYTTEDMVEIFSS